MSKLTFLRQSDAGTGVQSRLPAARILEGDPVFTSWEQSDGGISSGIWTSTEGAQIMARDAHTWEHFHILEGEVEICDEAGSCQRFGPGDSVTVPPGFRGVWRTLKAVRKSYVTIRSDALPQVIGG